MKAADSTGTAPSYPKAVETEACGVPDSTRPRRSPRPEARLESRRRSKRNHWAQWEVLFDAPVFRSYLDEAPEHVENLSLCVWRGESRDLDAILARRRIIERPAWRTRDIRGPDCDWTRSAWVVARWYAPERHER